MVALSLSWQKLLRSKQAYVVSPKNVNSLRSLSVVEKMIHMAAVRKMFWKEVKQNLQRFVVYGVSNLVLLILGSLVFFYVEHCRNITAKSLNVGEASFMTVCNDYLILLQSSNTTNANVTEATIKLSAICQENKAEVLDERSCELTLLAFFQWLEYTFSVAFTLGYGRMLTRSNVGKMLTIAYAIPTITLSTITYVYCGNMVKHAAKLFIVYVEVDLLKNKAVKKLTLKTFMLQLVLCIVLILLFSLFFTISDQMQLDYLNSFYFVMVTLLTIGFGDIVVDLEKLVENPAIFVLGNIMFIFGLGTLASLITTLCDLRNQEAPVTEFIKKTTKKIGPIINLKKTSQRENSGTAERTS